MIKKDYTREELKAKKYFELRDIAKKKNVENVSYMSEENLIESILLANSQPAQAQTSDFEDSPKQDPPAVGGYTREDFQNMTIHSVRTIVREVGITPSTKNKEQLIEAYLDLMQNGGIKEGQPSQPKTKRGRPAKLEVPTIVKDNTPSFIPIGVKSDEEVAGKALENSADDDNKIQQNGEGAVKENIVESEERSGILEILDRKSVV